MSSALMKTYNRAPIKFDHGNGMRLYSDSGEEYLDFGAGIAVSSLGHNHPALVAALQSQAGKLWHTSNLYEIAGSEELAGKLCDNSFADVVFFTNSGAEAMECAIKMVRKYHSANGDPQKFRIITFEGAFHGRTLTTIAAGGKEQYLAGFGPVVDGFDQVALEDVEAVENAIGDATAAILIEPVLGEGGIKVVSNGFLKALRRICDENGLLLVLDEVQSGIGRTGRFFAHEWAGITPDIVASAKGIGGGFPMGACLATNEAAKGMAPGTHGSTYGGNPLAMAVGNAVMDVILADGFLENVERRGLVLKQKLARLVDEYRDLLQEVRGLGLLTGVKCKVPNSDLVAALFDEKMLAVPAGENVVRLIPPLIASDDDIDAGIEKLEAALKALRAKSANTEK